MNETVISEKKCRGFVLRTKRISGPEAGGGKSFDSVSAYTEGGAYIGDERRARTLVKRGIVPELIDKKHRVCSVGFCEREKKWYGWSHRAIVGFGVGDMIFEEEFGTDETPFVQHGMKPIRTMADARLSAVRFAKSVS